MAESVKLVENSQDAPSPNIYKYTATMKVLVGEKNHDVDFYSIKTIVIDSNYAEMNMPMIFITASIDRKVVDLMIKHQDSGTVILDIKRCITNSDMPELYTDYIVDKFVYFIPDDINKNDEQDFEGQNEGRTDLFKLVTFGLLSLDHVNRNKKVLNGVLSGKLSSIMYYLTSHLPILIEPPKSNKYMKSIYVPPQNSVARSIEYLNKLKTFYDTPYRFFIDFDCSYLLSTTGKAVKKKGETITDVLITLKASYDPASKVQGMIIDENQKMYKLEIGAIDVELADNHISDKSYTKIVATGTSGSSSNASLANRVTGSVVNAKTKAIRVANDNTGLLNQLKSNLDTSAIQILVQKTDIDSQVLTMNKEYTIKADEVYGKSDYNGRYLLTRKRELYIREDNNFVMSTMLLFKKVED